MDSKISDRNQPALSSDSHTTLTTSLNKAQRRKCKIIGNELIVPGHYGPVAFGLVHSFEEDMKILIDKFRHLSLEVT